MANVKRVNALGITKVGTGISDVPDAPTIGTATGGAGAATVTFTAATTGGTATSFTATSSPGSITGTASSSPITIEGLTNGTAYTFTVTATNSTGTSPASSASNSVTPVNLGDMDAIAMVEVGSAVSTITFSSIPSTYKHLQIRGIWKGSTTPSDVGYLELTINGTSSGYSYHNFRGDGSTVTNGSSGSIDRTYPALSLPSSPVAYSNMFGTGIIDILDYANTNKHKTITTLFGFDGNGTGRVGLSSGSWQNANAITSIELKDQNAGNFVQYSSFALYGIKG